MRYKLLKLLTNTFENIQRQYKDSFNEDIFPCEDGSGCYTTKNDDWVFVFQSESGIIGYRFIVNRNDLTDVSNSSLQFDEASGNNFGWSTTYKVKPVSIGKSILERV